MYKSKRKTNQTSLKTSNVSYSDSEIIKHFHSLAIELEEKQDRYERLVKISRDITIESKRLIFFLHTFQRGLPEGEKILTEARSRLINLVKTQFSLIMKELHDRDIHQFLRSYSFGIQEFVEAFSFYNFLLNEELLTYQELKKFLQIHSQDLNSAPLDDEFFEKEEFEVSEKCSLNTNITVEEKNKKSNLKVNVKTETNDDCTNRHCIITIVDYILGLNDLTGELMRYCINQVSSGQIQTAFDVCRFLSNLYTGMLSVGFNNREFNRKMFTVIQSVKKVEMACYTVRVRGSEIPKHMIINVLENDEENDNDVHF